MADLGYDGKVAIITGAGGGLGREHALLLADRGAQIVVNDLGGGVAGGDSGDLGPAEQVVKEIEAAGGVAVADGNSVATPEGGEAIVQTALDAFGRVDIVINNAGILRDKTFHNMTPEFVDPVLDVLINNAGILRDKTLFKMDLAMWDKVIDVHLKGTFLCTQAAAMHMKERGAGGSIVNTTSVSGMMGNFGQTNYSAAKAGIYGLTRTTSIELQRFNIRVNAVAPVAKTRMTEDLPMFEKIGATMSPDHIAPAHLFLASDLSRDLSGVILSVAGAKMSIYKVVESPGKFKEADSGVWTAQEIAEHWAVISKL